MENEMNVFEANITKFQNTYSIWYNYAKDKPIHTCHSYMIAHYINKISTEVPNKSKKELIKDVLNGIWEIKVCKEIKNISQYINYKHP